MITLTILHCCEKDLHLFVEASICRNMIGRCTSSTQRQLDSMDLYLAGEAHQIQQHELPFECAFSKPPVKCVHFPILSLCVFPSKIFIYSFVTAAIDGNCLAVSVTIAVRGIRISVLKITFSFTCIFH